MTLSSPISNNDIGNNALIYLKQDPDITNLDPPSSPAENLVSEVLASVRQATLRSYPWNFAIKRLSITADVAVPAFGYKKQFTFPPDFVRYLNRFQSDGTRILNEKENFQIEGGKLLLNDADQTTAHIRYIFDETVVARWDPLFKELMAVNLAIRISSHFTGGKGWVGFLTQERLRIQTEARAIDGQERPPVRRESSKWIRARRGRGGRDNTIVDFS